MTFWHNQKYDLQEKINLQGDSLRGIPSKNFPWLLKKIVCADTQLDNWDIQVFCQNIVTNEYSKKVRAHILIQGKCIVSNDTLKKMKLDYERLFQLNLENWNILEEKYSFNIDILFDNIEEKCSDFYKIFFHKIKSKYTLDKKKQIIFSKIKNCKISNFS